MNRNYDDFCLFSFLQENIMKVKVKKINTEKPKNKWNKIKTQQQKYKQYLKSIVNLSAQIKCSAAFYMRSFFSYYLHKSVTVCYCI